MRMEHLWNMGDGGWVESRKDGYYLCSSYTSNKGFSRGTSSSSERKLSEEEYQNLLKKEADWKASAKKKAEKELSAKEEKRRRIEAYRRYSPINVGGQFYEITPSGEIHWEGNFVEFIPRLCPTSEIEARKLITASIEAVYIE